MLSLRCVRRLRVIGIKRELSDVTLAALDPWILEFEQDDYDTYQSRIEALESFVGLVDKHPDLDVLRFVDADYWTAVDDLLERQVEERLPREAYPVDRQGLWPWISRFCCHDVAQVAPPPPVVHPGLTQPAARRWSVEVAAAIQHDNGAHWRDPIVFIPRCREQAWKITDNEIDLAPSDPPTFGVNSVRRVVVYIDDPAANPLFVLDFDPWTHERSRSASDRRGGLRDLPRPSDCVGLPMRDWAPRLQGVRDTVDSNTEQLDFLPQKNWKPCAVGKEQWRSFPFGPHKEKSTKKGPKKGPEDRRGRIWSWDETHCTHWDVQHEDEKLDERMNVRPDGLITRHYGMNLPRSRGQFHYAAIFSNSLLMNFNSNSIGLT